MEGLGTDGLASGRGIDHDEVWRRWRLGEARVGIARGLGIATGRVTTVLRRHGGIAPRPARRRAGALTALEPAYAWRLATYCARRAQTAADPALSLRYRSAALTQAKALQDLA